MTGRKLFLVVRGAPSHRLPSNSATRAQLGNVYARLREQLECKQLRSDRVKTAALEALTKAKADIEREP